MELLFFKVGKNHCAIPLESVEGVELSAALTNLPAAPDIVAGCLNYRGRILPVIRTSACFGMPEEEMRLEDRLIVVRTARRQLILWVNSVSEVIHEKAIRNLDIPGKVNRLQGLRGVTEIEGEVVLIQDLEAFLSAEEDLQLEAAIRAKGTHGK